MFFLRRKIFYLPYRINQFYGLDMIGTPFGQHLGDQASFLLCYREQLEIAPM
jgi:hypothetical protein